METDSLHTFKMTWTEGNSFLQDKMIEDIEEILAKSFYKFKRETGGISQKGVYTKQTTTYYYEELPKEQQKP